LIFWDFFEIWPFGIWDFLFAPLLKISPHVPDLSDQPLAALQQRIAYAFRDPQLLMHAVTHPSYLHEHPEETENNQRLEFLGDAVLQLVVTEELFIRYPTDREGALSKNRSALSKGVFLSQLARQIGLAACLRLSASEEQTGGRDRSAALEDVFEALVGAIYLDSDLATTRSVVLGLYGSFGEYLTAAQPTENPKGRLQELVQPLHGNHALRYEVIATQGEDHNREYDIQVFLNNEPLGTGHGKSKKAAEEEAARIALVKMKTGPES
jgi:ribonuclease-3